ncbi:5-oxoprolinase subunit C family protein [Aneurinibacillus sp. REN35]|uniref:5-oxoprolinase subunit C family protein n=1 Tax=Aneurinibacillus sp. REN35 TaxID=3237286 RepID=UPI003527E1B4
MLKIWDAGAQVTIQDLGRNGYRHLGVSASGAADQYSFTLGNLLLGNPLNFAGIEISQTNLIAEFQKKTVIAVTGALADVYVNNKKKAMWETIAVNEGDVISIKVTDQGVNTYLCNSGGVNSKEMFGSRATYILNTSGISLGQKIEKDQEIPLGENLPGVFKQLGKRIPQEYIPTFPSMIEVRAVFGLSSYRISDQGLQSFLNAEWIVMPDSNRVSYQYKGTNVYFQEYDAPFGAGSNSSNVVDIAYPMGVIMVPNNQEVIVMLRDGMTGGGFVTIGAVITPDLDLISQSIPGQQTRFIAVTVEQAVTARLEKKKRIEEVGQLLRF